MIFERFVFIASLLLCYVSFLLGLQYKTSMAYIPLILSFSSLCSIVIVTGLQLQILVHKKAISVADKWSTITWSVVHLGIHCILFLDGLELSNILVVLCLYGILLTTIIIVVGTCSCYVILQNSRSWYAHVYLTCVCFWVFIQFMSLRTPDSITEQTYMSTIPIVAMAILRITEDIEYGGLTKEIIVWVICVVLHIVYENHGMTHEQFLWGTMIVLVVLCLKEARHCCMLFALPFVLVPFFIYVTFSCQRYQQSALDVMKKYDELFGDNEIIRIPLEEFGEDNWEERL
jgi:hypothetical protein